MNGFRDGKEYAAYMYACMYGWMDGCRLAMPQLRLERRVRANLVNLGVFCWHRNITVLAILCFCWLLLDMVYPRCIAH